MTYRDTIAVIRDVALVVLAILGIAQLLVLLALSIVLYRKVGPLLDSARTTLSHMQGSSAFLAETVVQPVIRVAGFTSGLSRGVSIFLSRVLRRGG